MAKNLALFFFVGLLFPYLVVETGSTYLYRIGYLDPWVLWVVERSENEGFLRPNEKTGVHLSARPTRVAVWNSRFGLLSQYKSRGNNYGFSSHNDFTAKKNKNHFRVAVFGDSMSAGFYTKPWVAHVEERLSAKIPIEIYNFSIDGAGLSNWHSTLQKIVIAENFDIDAIVLAICFNDLYRPFYRTRSERPLEFVEIYYDGTFGLEPDKTMNWFSLTLFPIYDSEKFDKFLDGQVTPVLPKREGLYLANFIKKIFFPENRIDGNRNKKGDRKQLLIDFKNYAKSKNIPIYVIHTEDLSEGFSDDMALLEPKSTHSFYDEIEPKIDLAFPNDGHFSKAGHEAMGKHLSPLFESYYQDHLNRKDAF